MGDKECTRRSKANLQESVLSFYHTVLGIKSRFPGLATSPISKRLNTHSPWKKQSNGYLSDWYLSDWRTSWMSLCTSSTPGWYLPLMQAVTSNGFLNFSSTLIISSGRCKFPTELLWAVNELKQVGGQLVPVLTNLCHPNYHLISLWPNSSQNYITQEI